MLGKLPLTCSSHSVTQECPVKAVKQLGGCVLQSWLPQVRDKEMWQEMRGPVCVVITGVRGGHIALCVCMHAFMFIKGWYVYVCVHVRYCIYGQKFWRGIYFGGLEVLRAIHQHFHLPTIWCYHYVHIIKWCHHHMSNIVQNVRFKSFKLRKNRTKIVKIWSAISWFQCGLTCYGWKGIQQCLHC